MLVFSRATEKNAVMLYVMLCVDFGVDTYCWAQIVVKYVSKMWIANSEQNKFQLTTATKCFNYLLMQRVYLYTYNMDSFRFEMTRMTFHLQRRKTHFWKYIRFIPILSLFLSSSTQFRISHFILSRFAQFIISWNPCVYPVQAAFNSRFQLELGIFFRFQGLFVSLPSCPWQITLLREYVSHGFVGSHPGKISDRKICMRISFPYASSYAVGEPSSMRTICCMYHRCMDVFPNAHTQCDPAV